MQYKRSTVDQGIVCKTGPAEQHCRYEKAKQILPYDDLASMASYELTQKWATLKCTEEAARAAE
jgi:hypothetical protein